MTVDSLASMENQMELTLVLHDEAVAGESGCPTAAYDQLQLATELALYNQLQTTSNRAQSETVSAGKLTVVMIALRKDWDSIDQKYCWTTWQ